MNKDDDGNPLVFLIYIGSAAAIVYLLAVTGYYR